MATHHPYLSACGVDKSDLKWRQKQLAVDCGVGSLIAINGYRFVANCKHADFKPSRNITLWIIELRISTYLSLFVSGGFSQNQSHMWYCNVGVYISNLKHMFTRAYMCGGGMRGDHCQNSILYKIIYLVYLIIGLQVRQQTVRIYRQPGYMFKWIEFAMHASCAAL